jgi:hypothetical protein
MVLRKDRFTDLVKFPTEFDNDIDALTTYNEFGSWHKVQFKITSKVYNDGVLTSFCLGCIKRGGTSRFTAKVTQGVVLKDNGES